MMSYHVNVFPCGTCCKMVVFANGAISDPSRFMVFCETMAWGGVGWGGDVNIL